MIGETEGERRLADALRPFDQHCVVALAGAVGLREESFRLFMAEELRIVLRRNSAVEDARTFIAHCAASDPAAILAAPSRLSTISAISAAISSSDL